MGEYHWGWTLRQATKLLALTTEGTDRGLPGELGMCRPLEPPPHPLPGLRVLRRPQEAERGSPSKLKAMSLKAGWKPSRSARGRQALLTPALDQACLQGARLPVRERTRNQTWHTGTCTGDGNTISAEGVNAADTNRLLREGHQAMKPCEDLEARSNAGVWRKSEWQKALPVQRPWGRSMPGTQWMTGSPGRAEGRGMTGQMTRTMRVMGRTLSLTVREEGAMAGR